MDTIISRAYQAYQKENYVQCLRFLQELKEESVEKLDLLAQTYFKMRDFQKAYDTYQRLIDVNDEFQQERKENVQTLIVCAQLSKPGTLKLQGDDQIPRIGDIVSQVELINLNDKTVTNVCPEFMQSKRIRKERKRKVRLPKQYDPVAGPDPERWIPRRDRKANIHRQKKRRPRTNVKGKSRVK